MCPESTVICRCGSPLGPLSVGGKCVLCRVCPSGPIGHYDELGPEIGPSVPDPEEERARAEQSQRRLEAFLGGRIAAGMTFDSFKTLPENAVARSYCESFNPKYHNLYLWGLCGRGKTHLAYAVAGKTYLTGARGEILTPRTLSGRFRSMSGSEESEEFKRLAALDFLVLNEFGITRSTDYAIETLVEILDVRYLLGRRGAIITSNLSPDALAEKLQDDRIPSRLPRHGFTVIEVGGPDWGMERK